MKRMYFLIIIIFTVIILSICIFKQNENKKQKKIETNLYKNYPFYKEELKEEYQEYQQKTNLSIKQSIINVNIGLNRPFYDNPVPSKNPNALTVLVNKYNYLKADFEPNNLVTTEKYAKSNLKLQKEAYDAFTLMAQKAEQESLNLRIVSAYRSFAYQNSLYNNYLKYESQEKVDTYSARSGHSEHQTGLAIDIDNIAVNYNRFQITQEFTWMQQNAYKYGFILRYPLGKEKITGYKYEPWHYRYVGIDIANYIHDNDITFDEYYAEFLD